MRYDIDQKVAPMDIQHCKTFLFVPANRPERISKALASGADAVIVDLEDAVAPDAKDAARRELVQWLAQRHIDADANGSKPVLVRVNGADTQWHAADLAACCASGVAAIMLPKAESRADLECTYSATGKPVLPIIESAVGLHQLQQIAQAPRCARLVFGKLDLAIDLGLEQADDDRNEHVFQPYRAPLVVASRLAGLPSPVDGVFTALDDNAGLAAYARRARRDGFGAILLIHPRQVAPVAAALTPSTDELAWARRVLAATLEASGNAAVVDGRMVDAPVIARAKRLLAAIA